MYRISNFINNSRQSLLPLLLPSLYIIQNSVIYLNNFNELYTIIVICENKDTDELYFVFIRHSMLCELCISTMVRIFRITIHFLYLRNYLFRLQYCPLNAQVFILFSDNSKIQLIPCLRRLHSR